MSQLPAFLTGLLAEAGHCRNTIRSIEPLHTGVTNRTSLIKLRDDTRYILREYEWPYDTDDDLQRVEKELYLHDLLLNHDVPVPAIVAHHDDESGRAVLMEFKSGSYWVMLSIA
ncbi:MAG: phosphotransferase [Gemmatimonadetes bacterium]|nr:phosphotransferase [Gemmatimonadota bacterium]